MSDFLWDALFVLSVTILVLSPILLVRNHFVYRTFSEVLHEVSAAAQEDIVAGRPWEWRYDSLNRVSYNEAVCKLWRKPRSFFDPLMTTRGLPSSDSERGES